MPSLASRHTFPSVEQDEGATLQLRRTRAGRGGQCAQARDGVHEVSVEEHEVAGAVGEVEEAVEQHQVPAPRARLPCGALAQDVRCGPADQRGHGAGGVAVRAQLRRGAVEPERRQVEVRGHVHADAHLLREAHGPQEGWHVFLVHVLAHLAHARGQGAR